MSKQSSASESRMARDRVALSPAARDRLIHIASPLLLLLFWEMAARLGWIDARFFPPPSRIFGTLVALSESGELWKNTWASLQRLFWGALIGGAPALFVGITMGIYRPLRAALDPLIAA